MKRSEKKRGGFTLIELLVVVSLMVLVTTIVVTSAFGLTRGASFSAAENTVFKYLEYARQRACMDGKEVVACFFSDASVDPPRYSVALFERAGVVTEDPAEGRIVDRYNLMENDVSGRTIWNFDSGKLTTVSSWKLRTGTSAIQKKLWKGAGVSYEGTQLQLANLNGWKKGDPYGFEVADRQDFPKGFETTLSGASTGSSGGSSFSYFAFCADGRATKAVKIVLKETVSNKTVEINVSQNGAVTLK